MAEAAVTFLLEKVQKLLADHLELISGAESELKKLESELDLMKAFLVESANKREKGEVFKKFEQQIRNAVFEAEDTIDTCLIEKSRSFLKRNLTTKRLSLAKQVKTLRETEVQPIFDRARTGFGALPIADVSGTPRSTSKDENKKIPLIREDNVVGFDGEANTVIEYLKEDSQELDVISIIGMPGLGKTTLAWKIYRDKRIEYEFPTIIWVFVSQDFTRRDVFITILKKFTQQDMSSKNDHELAQLVRSYLEKPKFVLFMDDVWTTANWREIENALPKSNKLGKVVITSRHEEVAKIANPKRSPHRLSFLELKESWELLQLEVFGDLDDCPVDLQALGKRIAKQCGGVPLAIVVIGGILLEKSSTIDGDRGSMRNEWQKVSDSVSTYLTLDKEKRTEKFIALSYNNMPHDLRDCFLYLGIFPEDTEILAWKLTRLWIAEGFIQQKPGKSLEEVAEDNLMDLINRNLVMVGKTKAEGHVKTCRVHDMIREFCKDEASLAKQNLFQEMKRIGEGVFDPPVSKIQKHRRLCIHSYIVDFLRKKPKGPRVRSFLCFSKEPFPLSAENIPTIPDAFDLLRVLDANPIKFPKFPVKLTQLIHLRYIALSGDDFKALPEAASKLWNLQTIRIDTMSRSLEIKADIWKMVQLRHLKTKAAIILHKEGKGEGGENLQTLSRLSAQCCSVEVLKKASNLTNLGIRGQLEALLDSKCLEKLDRLQKLKLIYDVHPNTIAENPLRQVPQPNRFPPNLRILQLTATHLDWKHMSTLGMISALEVLKLKENAFVGSQWEAVEGGFKTLEFLHIARTDLEFWTASGDPFPALRCLVLKNCEKLQEIPLVLAKSLQILDIERAKSAVNSAKKIKEEKLKMQGPQRAKRGGFKLIIAPGDE